MIALADNGNQKLIDRTNASRRKANKLRAKQGHPRMRAAIGVILDGEAFTIEAFCDRLGITRSQLTELRRHAEQVGAVLARQVGKRVKILGSDYLSFLKSCPEARLKSKEQNSP